MEHDWLYIGKGASGRSLYLCSNCRYYYTVDCAEPDPNYRIIIKTKTLGTFLNCAEYQVFQVQKE